MPRTLEVYGDHFWSFYNDTAKGVQEKIDYVLEIIISFERVPKKFFKHVVHGIYEIRVERDSNIYQPSAFLIMANL